MHATLPVWASSAGSAGEVAATTHPGTCSAAAGPGGPTSRFGQEARQQQEAVPPQQQQQQQQVLPPPALQQQQMPAPHQQQQPAPPQRPEQQQPEQQVSGRLQAHQRLQQEARPRPSGLVDDGSLWVHSGERTGNGLLESEAQHPLAGDAGPFHHEQEEVSWEDEPDGAVPSSPPPAGAAPSALPPGAIM
jgi:hypothetical protein